EAALAEEVGRLGREHDELLEAGLSRALLDRADEHLAATGLAELVADREAGELARLLGGERVERGAAEEQPVALDHHEAIDVVFEELPRAVHEEPGLLERLEDPQDRRYVAQPRGAYPFVELARD